MFDTNFWGAANVSRAAVAFFREVNAQGDGGRLIQISSIGGFIGLPGLGYHSASKSGTCLYFVCVLHLTARFAQHVHIPSRVTHAPQIRRDNTKAAYEDRNEEC